MTIGAPPAGLDPSNLSRMQRKAAKHFEQHSAVWEIAKRIVECADPHYKYTNLAVSKNFVGSPHRDEFDIAYQFALSLGDFTGGGELCVETMHDEVTLVDTHGKIAKLDGRFPHWVSGYTGTRYSLIWYRVMGESVPIGSALPL